MTYQQQPPAGYGPPPPGYQVPPAQPPKKRKKWPWIVLGVFLVMVIGCIGVVSLIAKAGNDVVQDLDDTASGKKAIAGEMGKAARDGKFEFTVSKMECGKTSVGADFTKVDAQGAFCIVSIKVKNIGAEAQTFDGTSQKARDAKGTEYSNSTEAEIAVNKNATTFLEQINPGNQVTGQLVYDVPEGTKLTEIELHDSFLSNGVKVPLK
ncbi:DUF4352 domain-containing protein [Actinoplanes sp. CA-142083]|uniref:DUF4352 domain-containing protein n=1 Tax=Actinoplanes sp. CA-142083 TaxID=3239903 RepID=UPI003D8D17A1